MITNANPPKFYDLGIDAADYQVVFFLKRKWDKPITF